MRESHEEISFYLCYVCIKIIKTLFNDPLALEILNTYFTESLSMLLIIFIPSVELQRKTKFPNNSINFFYFKRIYCFNKNNCKAYEETVSKPAVTGNNKDFSAIVSHFRHGTPIWICSVGVGLVLVFYCVCSFLQLTIYTFSLPLVMAV